MGQGLSQTGALDRAAGVIFRLGRGHSALAPIDRPARGTDRQRLSKQHAGGGHLHPDHPGAGRPTRRPGFALDDAIELCRDPRRHDHADRLQHQSAGLRPARRNGRDAVLDFSISPCRVSSWRAPALSMSPSSPRAWFPIASAPNWRSGRGNGPSIHCPDQCRRVIPLRRHGPGRRIFPATQGTHGPLHQAPGAKLRPALRRRAAP